MSFSIPTNKIFLSIALFMATIMAFAQQTNINLEGRVCTEEGEPMIGVLVRIMTAKDSLVKGGAMTDSIGHYKVAIAPGEYIAVGTFISHRPGYLNFNVTPDKPQLKLPDLVLESNDVLLDAAVVTASVPPVTVQEDTVAYNADAYHAPEGSMVEDLIERIPGAEITDDGKVKINGKVFDHILIDGKEFFGNDPQAVLRNLPANIIKRIKTYDRKSDQARLTGIDDGEENNVLDLEIKQNLLKGVVGQVSGAYGNQERYSGNLNLNKFRKDNNFALMGGMNNVNNPAFSEKGNGAENYSRASLPGLTASKGFGVTYAKEKKNKYRISGNARYNYTNRETQSARHSETAYNDSNYRFSNSDSHAFRRRAEFNTNFNIEYHFDSMTVLQVRPSISYSRTTTWNESNSDSENWYGKGDTLDVNKYHGNSDNISTGHWGSLSMILTRKLNKKGRNVSVNASTGYYDFSGHASSWSTMTYFQQPHRNYNRNRYYENDSHSNNYGVGMSYNEPLAKYLHLQFSYQFTRRYARSNKYGHEVNYGNNDSIDFDSRPDIDWTQVPIDTTLSNCSANTYLNHVFNLNMRHVMPKMNLSYGVRFNPRHNETNYIFGQKMDRGLISQNLTNWAPNLNFKYRFTKHNSLTIQYHGTSSEPDMEQLQEVIDKANPENIRYGNPNLKPSFTNQLKGNFNLYGPNSHQSLVTNLNYSTTDNTTSTMILSEAATGIRVSKLMNVSGRWNLSGNINFNTPLPIDTLETLTMSTTSSFDYNEYTNYNSTPLTQAQLTEAGITKDFMDITLDEIDLLQPLAIKNETHTLRLRQYLTLRYKPTRDYLFRLTGGVNYYRVVNSVQSSNSRETFDYTLRGNVQLDLPLNLQFMTDFGLTSRHGYSSGIQKNIFMWNAQLAKRLFKDNAGLLSFQIFDLLHQRSNISRNISNLTITDTRSQVLRSYFLIAFQYRLNTMGSKKK